MGLQALLSTTPQSSIALSSSSSSRIHNTLAQRNHIPAHVYKHPAAILLELCTSMEELHQIIPLIIKNGLYEEHLFQTKLVSLFCKYGSLTEATRVFDSIEDKNDVVYHTMLKGYAQNSSIFDGVSFFCRMMDDGVQPVVYNFTYLLKGCGDLERGQFIHRLVNELGLHHDVSVMNYLISMYCKCKRVDIAAEIFENLKGRTLVSWNAMILGCAQNGRVIEALNHFRSMKVQNIEPDSFTMVSIIAAVSELSILRQGKWIHGLVLSAH
ncbi:hypothetical protein L6452_02879 [Arctium lappa]|uniref:Uncharacterized protein n=1 Tax=Arctium lappa TaxID=4217 RepID=A0ACB9FKT9_ARCLA|nr:hypothetical protein L6452_02879 [Arctium lappa]